MKLLSSVLILLLCLTSVGMADPQKKQDKLQIKKLPKDIKEFKKLRDQLAQTPEGGAMCFLLALKLHTENPKLGKKCLIYVVDRKRLRKDHRGYKGYSLSRTEEMRLEEQLRRHPYLPDSYFVGSSPENSYTPETPLRTVFPRKVASKEDLKKGKCRLFVHSSGADSPRPLTLYRNNRGIWKADSWSSIIVGIRKPKSEEIVDDDL